jgi:hypothetical protein
MILEKICPRPFEDEARANFRLFAVTGNLCVFPGCTQSLVDKNSGKVTGEICHIKAQS